MSFLCCSKSRDVNSYLIVPPEVQIYRRDGKDIALIKEAISAEYLKIQTEDPKLFKSTLFNVHMKGFSSGLWAGHEKLGGLYAYETVAYNMKASADNDHWYEINTSNSVLFDNLSMRGLPEVIPGRLFSTRMPREVDKPESREKFTAKVREHNLNTVLILAETDEYQKYAGGDIEAFYRSIGLEVIHRPIVDFSLPDQPGLIADIKDITWRLSEGKNCLVHCAGGNGRTGMVIAGVMKNLGHRDPIPWVRRVKTVYCETPEQEAFVNNLPAVLDQRVSAKHPLLAKAVAAEHILGVLIGGKLPINAETTDVPEDLKQDYGVSFDAFDEDRSGYIDITEMYNAFLAVGAEVSKETVDSFFVGSSGADEKISREEFVQIMAAHKKYQQHGASQGGANVYFSIGDVFKLDTWTSTFPLWA